MTDAPQGAHADQAPIAPGWVWMLRAAAAYNLLVAVPPLFARTTSDSDRIVSLLVACFGVIYALIARAPARLAPVLWAGVLGKLGVLIIMGMAVLDGRQPVAVIPVLAGDALFTLAFIAFLRRMAARPAP